MGTTRRAAFAATAALALGLGACSGEDGAGAGPSGDDAVSVVATTTQICDYVTQIAVDESADAELAFTKHDSEGDVSTAGADPADASTSLELTCLLAPNASAHEHEMTPQQMQALSDADLFLVSGVDLENFLDSAVESSGFSGIMGVTSGVLSSVEVDDPEKQEAIEAGLPYEVYRGDEKVDVEPWPFPPPNPGEAPEFRFDPHVWTSPAFAKVQVHNIGEALKKVAPDNAALFDRHVDRYEDELDDLDAWAKETLGSVPERNRVLFTSHDAFGYFSNRYDIDFIGTALSDFSAQQDATAEHIRRAAEQVKESGAVALFAENSNNSKSIEAIARAAGVKAIIGDDAMYGDSLGPEGSEGETYIKSIIHNVKALANAWGGTIAELPESIRDSDVE